MEEHFEAYGRWLVRRRRWVTGLIVLLTTLAIIGIAQRLQGAPPVDFTPQAMFMGEGGMWERLQGYEEEFGVEDNTVVILVNGPVGTTHGLAFLRMLHQTAADSPMVERVDSVVNASVAVRDEGGMIVVNDAIDEGEAPLARAAADPFLTPLLISSDQRAASIQIHLNDGLQQIADLGPAVKTVTNRIDAVRVPDGFTLHTTGIPFVRTEVVDMMIADEMLFFPLVTVIFLITIVTLFRKFWLGIVPLVGVLVATTWAMGGILSSGAVLNILSVLTPTLILVIGVADGIHLTARYREELVHDSDPVAAMGRTLRQMTLACFLTTFTTAAGFASLLVADTKVIRDFGGQVAVGVMITYVAVIVVVPTLLAWIPVGRVGRPQETVEHPMYDKLSAWVSRSPRKILAIALAITLAAGWMGRTVQTDSGLLEMYREGHPTWTAVHAAEESIGGVVPMFIHLSGHEGQMLEPDILQKTAQLQQHLDDQGLVGWSMSSAEWVRHFHMLLTEEDGWPTSREAAAQELFMAEMSGDLPLDRVLSADRARARIIAIAHDGGGRSFLEVKNSLEREAQILFDGTGVTVDVTGDGMLASEGVEQLIMDLLSSLGLVFGVIVLTMLALLRDVRMTIIATIPNVVPLVFILGTLGVIGADLQTSNIISFTVAVGLAVDDTIHFIVRYREERQQGHSTEKSIHKTLLGAGHAIVLTSILLVFGFGVLVFSPLTSTYFFGLLSCITMAAALLGDLIILPAMLQVFDKDHAS
jgi:uncharacterized protein